MFSLFRTNQTKISNLSIQKTDGTDVLDLSESLGADGTPILVYPRHFPPKIDNQIWNLIPV